MGIDDQLNENQHENRNSTNVDTPTNTGTDDNSVSNLWKYMSRVQNNKAKCNLCDAVLSRTNGTTTGMRKHLFLIHKLRCFATTSSKTQSKSIRLSIDEKKKLDSLAISCIVQDGRGFGDLRRPGLLKIFTHMLPGYVPPHRNTVQRRLQRLQSEHRLLLIKELSNVHSIGITCDFWSDKRLNSYMCLTGHYVTSTFQFVSKILSFSWFQNRHFSAHIAAAIHKELKELNILDTTRTLTTDGATNMLKIGDMLFGSNKRVHCVAHRLHLVVCNSLGFWLRKKRDSSSSSTTSVSEADVAAANSDDEDLTDDIESILRFSSASSSGCAIDGLYPLLDASTEVSNTGIDGDSEIYENAGDEESDYLSADVTDNWLLDVEEESDSSNFSLEKERIGALMKKCRSLVELVNKSSVLMNYVKNLKQEFNVRISLQLDCKSRWNSSHRLISTILAYKKIINKINSEKHEIGLNSKQFEKLSSNELYQSDWKMLELIDFVLHPFVHATKLISGSQYPTIGISYFAVIQIREFLDDSNDANSHDCESLHSLKKSLLNQIDKYFTNNEDQWEIMKTHAYFDPLGFGCLSHRERRAIELNIIEFQHQNKFTPHGTQDNQQIQNSSQLNLTGERNSCVLKESSMSTFLGAIGRKGISSLVGARGVKKDSINEEMIVYRSIAQREYSSIVDGGKEPNTMQFWLLNRNELKILSKLASHFLVTTATSVASESAFSTASYLLRKQRSRLTPLNLSYSMFLKDKLSDDPKI